MNKITITASMKGEDKIEIRINCPLIDTSYKVDLFRAEFKDAEQVGFSWDKKVYEYVVTAPASPEACAPFVEYAAKRGTEIVQL